MPIASSAVGPRREPRSASVTAPLFPTASGVGPEFTVLAGAVTPPVSGSELAEGATGAVLAAVGAWESSTVAAVPLTVGPALSGDFWPLFGLAPGLLPPAEASADWLDMKTLG